MPTKHIQEISGIARMGYIGKITRVVNTIARCRWLTRIYHESEAFIRKASPTPKLIRSDVRSPRRFSVAAAFKDAAELRNANPYSPTLKEPKLVEFSIWKPMV
jgi:hypothetical protein